MSTSSAAAPPHARDPWWRVGLGWLGTACAVLLTATMGLVEMAFALSTGGRLSGRETLLALLLTAMAVTVATALVWRSRYPVQVCVGAAALAVLLPLSALPALVALPWVIATTTRRTLAWCTAATAAAVTVNLGRDWLRDGDQVMWTITSDAAGERLYLSGPGYVAVGACVLVVAIGAGALRRSTTATRAARGIAADQAAQAATLRTQAADLRTEAADLRTELTRQEERELIAREMHDTVAHHLSLVSLHAAALEVTADDPTTDVPESARSMRVSAHRALDEMRALIANLRTDGDDSAERYAGPAPRLADLVRLLDDARTAGVDIGGTVFVDGGDDAPPALTRGVYRVVQEALTNAVKHAPGTRVDVDLRARAGDGVDVVVSNGLVDDLPPTHGAGAGLVGMRERAVALGGRLEAGPEDGLFVVRAHLPWAAPVSV